jgi:hypothetical protein
MSDTATTPRNKLWTSPLRDLIRGRISGRLDWKSRLAGAGLPAPAGALIVRVVKLTRLWRLEKAAVADELIAHFSDGVAAGCSAADLVDRFGDARVAARLIRRAKTRNRWLPRRAMTGAANTIAISVGVYGLLLIRFWAERPLPTVDYVAELNAPAARTLKSDRAWPLYRQAIVASSDGIKDGNLQFSKALSWNKDHLTWQDRKHWLEQHHQVVETIREASKKPVMGFILDDPATVDDRNKLPCNPGHLLAHGLEQDDSMRIHDRDQDLVMLILDLDTRRAVEANEGPAAVADLMASAGLARLQQTDSVSAGWPGIYWEMVWRTNWILARYPNVLTDDQLTQIAHAVSVPKTAADLLSDRSKYYVADLLQRIFTDDGSGDGHLTLDGLRNLQQYLSDEIRRAPEAAQFYALAAPIPLVTPSRGQLQQLFDERSRQDQANMQLPLRLVDTEKVYGKQDELADSPWRALSYGPWAMLFREHWDLVRLGRCEEFLGDRDGTLVGIALELYRRHHGSFPATLNELVPAFLPEVPVDRITGDPIKYRIVDGKPIVYSVGLDRIDDGGTPPQKQDNPYHCPAADWIGKAEDVDRHDDRRGDWVVYPAVPATEE